MNNNPTITLYPYASLGQADHGWLQARYHFSFARYWNPLRTGFGKLLVINDDIVAAGKGFAPHPHDNMEIITYVRAGAITHKDSIGHTGRTGAGDVQVMSAGTGVTHSEFNLEGEDTRLYQIWIEPREKNVAPRWETRAFPKDPSTDALTLLVSGQKEHESRGALMIHADAAIYGGTLAAGTRITQPIKHQAYILASEGSFRVGDTVMNQGDGAEVIGIKSLTITAESESEILIIDVPAI